MKKILYGLIVTSSYEISQGEVVKYLLNHFGVSSIVITGCDEKTKDSPKATHAWNVVKKDRTERNFMWM